MRSFKNQNSGRCVMRPKIALIQDPAERPLRDAPRIALIQDPAELPLRDRAQTALLQEQPLTAPA
jgi:hypothetical protein